MKYPFEEVELSIRDTDYLISGTYEDFSAGCLGEEGPAPAPSERAVAILATMLVARGISPAGLIQAAIALRGEDAAPGPILTLHTVEWVAFAGDEDLSELDASMVGLFTKAHLVEIEEAVLNHFQSLSEGWAERH